MMDLSAVKLKQSPLRFGVFEHAAKFFPKLTLINLKVNILAKTFTWRTKDLLRGYLRGL